MAASWATPSAMLRTRPQNRVSPPMNVPRTTVCKTKEANRSVTSGQNGTLISLRGVFHFVPHSTVWYILGTHRVFHLGNDQVVCGAHRCSSSGIGEDRHRGNSVHEEEEEKEGNKYYIGDILDLDFHTGYGIHNTFFFSRKRTQLFSVHTKYLLRSSCIPSLLTNREDFSVLCKIQCTWLSLHQFQGEEKKTSSFFFSSRWETICNQRCAYLKMGIRTLRSLGGTRQSSPPSQFVSF